jgi:hypothetical protein
MLCVMLIKRPSLAVLAALGLVAPPLAAQETASEPVPDAAPDYSPANAADIPPIEQLPVEQSGKARCAVMIAMVANWQNTGKERGAQWPSVDPVKGKAFFATVFGDLMDSYGVTDEAKMGAYIYREYGRFAAMPAVETDQIIPACLVLFEIVAG